MIWYVKLKLSCFGLLLKRDDHIFLLPQSLRHILIISSSVRKCDPLNFQLEMIQYPEYFTISYILDLTSHDYTQHYIFN